MFLFCSDVTYFVVISFIPSDLLVPLVMFSGYYAVQNYTLVEYRDVTSVDNVLTSCRQFPNVDHVPVQSRLLYYHVGRDRLSGASRRGFTVDHREFVDYYRLNVLTELDLQKCSSVSWLFD